MDRKRVLLLIPGGHGDVLSGTSVIPGLQEMHPHATIFAAVPVACWALLQHDPRVILVPDGQDCSAYDVVADSWHGRNWNGQIPVVQCREAKVRFSRPQMYFAPGERAKAKRYDIVLGTWTADVRRQYTSFPKLARLLAKKYNVAQVDNGPDVGVYHPDLTLREAAATIAMSRMLVTIDTGLMQIGIALQSPFLAILHKEWSGVHNHLIEQRHVINAKLDPVKIADVIEKHMSTIVTRGSDDD